MYFICAAALLLAVPPCVPGFLPNIPPQTGSGHLTSPKLWTGTGLPSKRQASETRLFVGGKIFGQEDEPAPMPEKRQIPKPEGQEANEDESENGKGEDAGQKAPKKKRRKKYAWAESGSKVRAQEEQRLAQEIARKYPDIGQVEVDRLGHIVGGVNPFEGTEVKLEDQYLSDYDEDFPKLGGEISGMDDPADSPWRLEAEKIIREQVESCGISCHDILWTFHKLEVTVMRAEGDGPPGEAAYVDSDKLMEAIKCVNTALEEKEAELFVLGRHELIVATPGAKDVLTTDKEFKAFKGFDVIIKTGGPFKKKRQLEGKLLERTFDELIITQDGRKVCIPLALVDEVRLPKAEVEAGDTGF